ncbi:hypothetical protein K491DRAFT_258942 [Lophiostoma macrostomum CBS 122681]|uniref:Apple domain-containing protein n=1 Tax=Lophiostoma macrostomum CBS 122681 TaxID=1314788 RepID=A0A6A6THU6_9PLEO|nr:hypothetical protein K491DRAFT_258942 [Lophiostoma macrostomum CBS 122681]
MASLISCTSAWRRLVYILTWLWLCFHAAARPQVLGVNVLPGVISPLTCTDGGGYTYTNGSTISSGNRQFQVLCGVDLSAQTELTAYTTPYLSLCVDACVANPYCVTTTYDKAAQRCSLKGIQGVLAVVGNIVNPLVGTLIQLSNVIALLPLNAPTPSPSLASISSSTAALAPAITPSSSPSLLIGPSSPSAPSTTAAGFLPQTLSTVTLLGSSSSILLRRLGLEVIPWWE